MIRATLAGLLLLSSIGPAATQSPPASSLLDRPDAFERAFAVSSYSFEACGDPLAGRIFRRALVEKFAHCPFSPEARSSFQQRIRAQQAKTRRMMDSMIEDHGGLPMRLDGMPMTCHEQHASDDYQRFRVQLDQYAQGAVSADAVIAAPCDAAELAP